MNKTLFLAIVLSFFSCCSTKQKKASTKVEPPDYIEQSSKHSRVVYDLDTLRYYKAIWNQKYSGLKHPGLVTPYNVSSGLWEHTMQKFKKNMEWIVPRIPESQTKINILNHPYLKTKEDFEKCSYQILPVYRGTANAMDFIDWENQDYGNFITLDTTLHLITIERDSEILAIFSHIDLSYGENIDRSFTNVTQNPFRTDKIIAARQFSDNVFAVIPAHTDIYINGASICFVNEGTLFSMVIGESITKIDPKTNKVLEEVYEYIPEKYSPSTSFSNLKKYFKKVDEIKAGKQIIRYNPQFIVSPEQIK